MDEIKKYEPIFGAWHLSKLIGKGSFGKVYEITREEFGTVYRAALKVISVPQDEDDVKVRMTEGTDIESVSEYYEGILKEIVNENEIMSKLKGNSNIVSYEDHQIIPHDDGIGYDILIRMELLTPLLDRLMEKNLEEREVVKLGIDICKALELCHKKKIIHRDIKPQNIFISDSGDFKLGDFGIAKTMEKTIGGMSKKGTYKYMAPEVFRGDDYDQTVDIYSLGIVLYSLLNGNRSPFLPAPPAKVTHNDEEEARARRFRGEPLPPPRDAGPMLTYILRKAAAANPNERYQTADQFRKDLESYLKNYNNKVEETTGFDHEATVIEQNAAPVRGGIQPNTQYTGSMPAQGYTGQYAMPPQEAWAPPQYARGPEMQAGMPSPKPKKGIKLIALAVLGMLLIAGLTVGVIKFMSSDSDEEGEDKNTAEETEQKEEKEEKAQDYKEGAIEYKGHYYKVITDSMSWDEAKKACEDMGGHLATIESAEEQKTIATAVEGSEIRKLHYWLGGHLVNGNWEWLDGTKIPLKSGGSGYQNWEEGKPNNNKEAAGATGTEGCLELQATKDKGEYMQWNDIDVDGRAIGSEDSPKYCSPEFFGYICEWDD